MLTTNPEKHRRRPAQIPALAVRFIHHSQRQSRDAKLVSFASLLAISRAFNSLSKVLFTFPSRYLFTIGLQLVFSLRRWSAWIHAGFHVSRITRDTLGTIRLHSRDSHPLWFSLSKLISFPTRDHVGSHNPGRVNPPGLGCSAFARHYLRNLFDFFSSAY